MSLSAERMNLNALDVPDLFSRDNASRKNANPTGLTVEQIATNMGSAFVDHLIRYRRERYNSQSDRHEVVCSDPIARFVCERWIEEITAKPFRSYEIGGEDPQVIMEDVWIRWEQLGMNEILHKLYPKLGGDGYCLYKRKFNYNTGQIDCDAYGFFESPPEYWKRHRMNGTPYHNVIYLYYVNYIPNPSGTQYLGNYNIHAVSEYIKPFEPGFIHLYRKNWNDGVGKARIQGIWASMTKLRKISHADYRRKSIFNILEIPEDMDDDFIEPLIESAQRADEMTGMYMPKRVNPQTQETEDFPRLYDRTMDQQGAAPGGDSSSGGTLLRSPEYARVLIDLGYTETKFVGSQPGEVTGSKLDLTRDDQVDIREFNLLKPTIKTLLEDLLEIGALEGCSPESLQAIMENSYDIKCHIEYEVLDNMMAQAEMAEQQAELDGQQATMNEFRMNSLAHDTIVYCLRNNINSPGMVPVQSSWLESMGVKDQFLWFKPKNWPYFAGYQFDTHEIARQKYLDASEGSTTKWGESGSTGAWIWENIWAEGVKPFSKGPRPTRAGIIGGARYSRNPFEDRDFGGFGGRVTQGPQELERQRLIEGGPGYIGTGATGAPLRQTPTFQYLGGREVKTGIEGPVKTPEVKYVKDPKDIRGYRQVGKGRPRRKGRRKPTDPTPPIRVFPDFQKAIDAAAAQSRTRNAVYDVDRLSYKRVNAIMQDLTGEGMSPNTWTKFKKFIESYKEQGNFRFNSIVVGNPMSFDVTLRYNNPNGGRPLEEKVCPKEWKKISAHSGNLFLYENLGHGGKKKIVGNYDYWWDEKEDKSVVKMNYDDEKIINYLIKWGKEDSFMMDRLRKNQPLSMSTEYYCSVVKHDGTKYQMNFHDNDGNPKFNGIALVERGNCDDPFCTFEPIKEENDETNKNT